MDTNHGASESQTRRAAVGGLAVVGFIALILIGIATAIYAASFIPKALTRLGSANVYLGTQDQSGVTVTSEDGNAGSIPLSPATTTAPASQQPAAPAPTYSAPTPTSAAPVYTQPNYQVVTVPQSYYGRPDLVTTITSVGYLRRDGDMSSFVADDSVPSGYQPAVRFAIANRGTNMSGTWNFEARLPSDRNGTYRSGSQRALAPGDSIVYTLGFDSTDSGRETIRITADANDRVDETNESNNDDTGTIYLNGGSSRTSDRDYDSNGTYCRYGTYYQNGRYYCESSDSNRDDSRDYDSNGTYCRYGTYYQNGRYYCDSSSGTSSNIYDSFGNLCRSGVRTYQNGIYACDDSYSRDNGEYDSSGTYCRYGTYYSNGRYYCS